MPTISIPRIPDLIKSKYQTSHGPGLQAVEDTIAVEKDVQDALQNLASESAPAQPSGGSSDQGSQAGQGSLAQSRTLATPELDGQRLPNFERRVTFEEKALADFQAIEFPS